MAYLDTVSAKAADSAAGFLIVYDCASIDMADCNTYFQLSRLKHATVLQAFFSLTSTI